jgi:hypothetical protein
MSRTNLSAVVSRQLPEHIREDYPTFVAFVEAYYEYLQAQGVDFSTIRDIDQTLESFIDQFKKELAYNLPNITQDERFLLQNIKDQYLAKGSAGSYKLLFRLLFGKEVELIYPGRSMLRASDGRWNQEISVFAKVDFGDIEDVVGKLVDIQTSTRILRVLVDRRQDLVGEVDRIELIDPALQVYEFYLDKKFFGNVTPGDKIRYRDEFQATILPATQKITISQQGKNFRVGQVFELRSGTGTGALLKVTAVTDPGGIKYAELIKFGIGYTADFSVGVLATNSIVSNPTGTTTANVLPSTSLTQENVYSSSAAGTVTASSSSATVTGTGTNFGQPGGPEVGEDLWTTDAIPKLIGVIKSIGSTTSLTLDAIPSQYGNAISGTYTGSYTFRNIRSVGSLYNPGGIQSVRFAANLQDRILGFDEQGYISQSNYVAFGYTDGTYAGGLLREFSLNYRNAQIDSDEPAIVEVDLGAIVRYPGYYETNNGFLDDSIFIQDSKYYQAFSYVLRIDERLSSYSSAVKTMLHPAGMALFGEFNITNNYDLSVDLESLVKSLGVGLEDTQLVTDRATKTPTKALSSLMSSPIDSITSKQIGTALTSTLSAPTDTVSAKLFTKAASDSQAVQDSATTTSFDKALATIYSGIIDSTFTRSFDKPLATIYSGIIDSTFTRSFEKSVSDSQAIQDSTFTTSFDKALATTYSGMLDTTISRSFDKSLATTYSGFLDSTFTRSISKSLSDSQALTDIPVLTTNKYVSTDTLGPQTETGFIGLNPYAGQDFFAAEYSVGSRVSTFTTP